jgi:hypothetical protein
VHTAFGREFDVPDGYLNTASIGVPPTCAADAVAAAVESWRRGTARAPDFDPAVTAGRAAFADLVGVPTERVAIGASVSALIGLVAARCLRERGCWWPRGSSPASRSRSPPRRLAA